MIEDQMTDILLDIRHLFSGSTESKHVSKGASKSQRHSTDDGYASGHDETISTEDNSVSKAVLSTSQLENNIKPEIDDLQEELQKLSLKDYADQPHKNIVGEIILRGPIPSSVKVRCKPHQFYHLFTPESSTTLAIPSSPPRSSHNARHQSGGNFLVVGSPQYSNDSIHSSPPQRPSSTDSFSSAYSPGQEAVYQGFMHQDGMEDEVRFMSSVISFNSQVLRDDSKEDQNILSDPLFGTSCIDTPDIANIVSCSSNSNVNSFNRQTFTSQSFYEQQLQTFPRNIEGHYQSPISSPESNIDDSQNKQEKINQIKTMLTKNMTDDSFGSRAMSVEAGISQMSLEENLSLISEVLQEDLQDNRKKSQELPEEKSLYARKTSLLEEYVPVTFIAPSLLVCPVPSSSHAASAAPASVSRKTKQAGSVRKISPSSPSSSLYDIEREAFRATMMENSSQYKRNKAHIHVSNLIAKQKLNERYEDGTTLLHEAVKNSVYSLTYKLVENYRNRTSNKTDNDNWIDLDVEDNHHRTPLQYAILSERTDFVGYLVESGADINKVSGGYAALHIASERAYCDVVQKLLEFPQIDINVKNNLGRTALQFAILSHGGILENRTKETTEILNCEEVIKLLLNKHARVDEQDICGQTAFHYAIEVKKLKLLEILVFSADKNQRKKAFKMTCTKKGFTPLHCAASLNDIPLMEQKSYINLLVSHGASPDIRDMEGKLPVELLEASRQELKLLFTRKGTDVVGRNDN